MTARGHALVYAATYAALQVVNVWIIRLNLPYMFNEAPNTVVGTKSWMTMILEPLNMVILCVCSSMIFIMEKNRHRVADLIRSEWGTLMGTPFVLLGMKVITVLDSIAVYVGLGSPVVSRDALGNYEMLYVIVFFIAVAALLNIPVTRYMKKRYPAR